MSEEFRILLQPEAVEGMESAYRWLEADSPKRAHKWVNGLMEAIESLKVFPKRYPLAPENEVFDEEIRQHLYGKRGGVYRILPRFTTLCLRIRIGGTRCQAQDNECLAAGGTKEF